MVKTSRYEGSDVRRVLAAMIVDTTVCSRIASRWEEGLFDSPGANLIARWCVNHVEKFNRAPGRAIQPIFEDWSLKAYDEATSRMIERVLRYVNSERMWDEEDEDGDGAERIAPEYVLELADRIFNRSRIRQAIDQAEVELDRGAVGLAFNKLQQLTQVELGPSSVIKPAEDFDAWRKAFDPERQAPLFDYPEGATDFSDSMGRDCLVAFMGPDKTGKSMFLLDAAVRMLKKRRRVAFFDTGDMTEDDVIMRLGERVARRPRRRCSYNWPIVGKDGKIELVQKTVRKPLSPQQAFKKFRMMCRRKDLFRLTCYPNSTVDVSGIEDVLRGWEREGWVADAVVIDYADIMAPPKGVRDPLEQVDTTWKQLRRLSQSLHCLVLTATQSNAAAYRENKGMLSRRHFSGRKTKLAHVTGMIGLNQSMEDKGRGLVKLNWVVRRHGGFSDRAFAEIFGCYEVSCPVLRVNRRIMECGTNGAENK